MYRIRTPSTGADAACARQWPPHAVAPRRRLALTAVAHSFLDDVRAGGGMIEVARLAMACSDLPPSRRPVILYRYAKPEPEYARDS
jgi:hypothetical protein